MHVFSGGNGYLHYYDCCDRTYSYPDGAIVAIGNVWLTGRLRPKRSPTAGDIENALADLREPPPGVTTALYRRFDEDDVLLYVGISDQLMERSAWHERHSAWVPFVVRRTTEWYASRSEAEAAETAAIKAEQPLFNRQHAIVGTQERLAEYLLTNRRILLVAQQDTSPTQK